MRNRATTMNDTTEAVAPTLLKTWLCVVCGFVYSEEAGLPSEGLAAGTRWEDVPEGWQCPECGVSKSDFEMVEI